jgi:hypothetical protein
MYSKISCQALTVNLKATPPSHFKGWVTPLQLALVMLRSKEDTLTQEDSQSRDLLVEICTTTHLATHDPLH